MAASEVERGPAVLPDQAGKPCREAPGQGVREKTNGALPTCAFRSRARQHAVQWLKEQWIAEH